MVAWSLSHLLLAIAVTVMVICPSTVEGQRQVRVVSMKMYPYLITRHDNGTLVYDGFIKELLDEVAKLTRVSFTWQTNDDFGEKLDNGTWVGAIGDVVSGKVDMAAGPLTITSERRKAVHFSVAFQNFGPVIVLKRPTFSQPTFQERFQRLFAPLSHSVWLMSLVAYFITSVVLYIVCHYNPYEWRHLHRDRQATLREAESFTCMNAFWFILSTWMWQGYTRSPRSLGGRLVVTFWWIFVVVFLLTYTASLTNLLRVGPTPLADEQYVRILSLEDLTKQQEVEFGFPKGGSTESYLKNAKVPYLERIWTDVKKKHSSLRVQEGVDRVRYSPDSAPFAFVMESAMASYMLRQKPCDLYMVTDLTITGAYALAFQPGWDLADRMDIALLLLKENGILKLLEDKWFAGQCHNNVLDPKIRDKIQVSPFYPVTLGSFSGVLVILVGGVFAGAIVTIVELVIYRKAEVTTPTDEAALPMKGRESDRPNSSKGDKKKNRSEGGSENITDV